MVRISNEFKSCDVVLTSFGWMSSKSLCISLITGQTQKYHNRLYVLMCLYNLINKTSNYLWSLVLSSYQVRTMLTHGGYDKMQKQIQYPPMLWRTMYVIRNDVLIEPCKASVYNSSYLQIRKYFFHFISSFCLILLKYHSCIWSTLMIFYWIILWNSEK